MHRIAFVDDQLVARDFNTGDVVRKAGLRDFVLTPYVGRVLYSNPDTGKVEVQWPWGAEIETASELIRDASNYYPALSLDQSYSTWEQSRNENSPETVKSDEKWRASLASRVVSKYEDATKPLWRAACEAWHCGMGEVDAYLRMGSVFGDAYGDDAVRLTVANLYELGRRTALYWKDQKRRYKVTQQEKSSGDLKCPRCKGTMKPRTYRQGLRVLLCKTCGFTIHPKDVVR